MSMLLSLVLQQALAATGLLVASQEPAATEPPRPFYLRVEVMLDTLRVVPCRIEASGAKAGEYDQAALDLDGDGSFETIVAAEEGSFGADDDRFSFCMPIEFGEAKFSVELFGPPAAPSAGKMYVFWRLNQGDTNLFFINGQVEVHDTPEAAAAGKALRLGPPFHFEARSSMRGPNALVNVGLKDANGATLRIARTASGGESRIQLTLEREGTRGNPMAAEYG